MSAGQQVTCSKPGGSMQKKLSVPRGRSNSISYKPYTSILPLKDIKDSLSSFETLEEFHDTGWSLRTLGMAFYISCLYLEVV